MHWFIVPDLDGPISGGTLFNGMLIAAANEVGCPCRLLPIDQARTVLARATSEDLFWVDSLYLDEFPALVRAASPTTPVALILHYLPSLVALGEGLRASELAPAETDALRAAAMVLVPSPFMRRMIERLAGAGRTIVCVEPGRLARGRATLPEPPISAVMVANLVPGKGVAPFLASLAGQIAAADTFHLTIVGGGELDRACAERCLDLGNDPRLRGRVRFTGGLAPQETVRLMAESNLFVSASVMESFGMALAEARTLGLPIVARTGGNVGALVEEACGGELVASPAELAAACLTLCGDSAEHRRRIQRAREGAWPPRSWAEAAREFSAQVARQGRSTPSGQARMEGTPHANRA